MKVGLLVLVITLTILGLQSYFVEGQLASKPSYPPSQDKYKPRQAEKIRWDPRADDSRRGSRGYIDSGDNYPTEDDFVYPPYNPWNRWSPYGPRRPWDRRRYPYWPYGPDYPYCQYGPCYICWPYCYEGYGRDGWYGGSGGYGGYGGNRG